MDGAGLRREESATIHGKPQGAAVEKCDKRSGGGGVDRAQLAVEGSRRKPRTDATHNRAE